MLMAYGALASLAYRIPDEPLVLAVGARPGQRVVVRAGGTAVRRISRGGSPSTSQHRSGWDIPRAVLTAVLTLLAGPRAPACASPSHPEERRSTPRCGSRPHRTPRPLSPQSGTPWGARRARGLSRPASLLAAAGVESVAWLRVRGSVIGNRATVNRWSVSSVANCRPLGASATNRSVSAARNRHLRGTSSPAGPGFVALGRPSTFPVLVFGQRGIGCPSLRCHGRSNPQILYGSRSQNVPAESINRRIT